VSQVGCDGRIYFFGYPGYLLSERLLLLTIVDKKMRRLNYLPTKLGILKSERNETNPGYKCEKGTKKYCPTFHGDVFSQPDSH